MQFHLLVLNRLKAPTVCHHCAGEVRLLGLHTLFTQKGTYCAHCLIGLSGNWRLPWEGTGNNEFYQGLCSSYVDSQAQLRNAASPIYVSTNNGCRPKNFIVPHLPSSVSSDTVSPTLRSLPLSCTVVLFLCPPPPVLFHCISVVLREKVQPAVSKAVHHLSVTAFV